MTRHNSAGITATAGEGIRKPRAHTAAADDRRRRLVATPVPVLLQQTGISYFGGKGASGAYQAIISQMRPHRVYIEAMLGSGRVMRMKLPADRNIGIDLSRSAVEAVKRDIPSAELKVTDGIRYVQNFAWQGGELVYFDPPYLIETRASKQTRYQFEITDHERLLRVAKSLPCDVIISGYWSELYARELAGWRTVTYQSKTRRGMATEWLWCNFEEPLELHDYRFLGRDYRERERIKKLKQRWIQRLTERPALERHALFAAIREVVDREHRQGRR